MREPKDRLYDKEQIWNQGKASASPSGFRGYMTKSRFGIKAKPNITAAGGFLYMTKSRFGIKAKQTAGRNQHTLI